MRVQSCHECLSAGNCEFLQREEWKQALAASTCVPSTSISLPFISCLILSCLSRFQRSPRAFHPSPIDYTTEIFEPQSLPPQTCSSRHVSFHPPPLTGSESAPAISIFDHPPPAFFLDQSRLEDHSTSTSQRNGRSQAACELSARGISPHMEASVQVACRCRECRQNRLWCRSRAKMGPVGAKALTVIGQAKLCFSSPLPGISFQRQQPITKTDTNIPIGHLNRCGSNM
ncbi:hypothetical protein QBC32DRAFT_104957 [Pseudoneurospora amorphoporcata]|uniref:Uncharacterized protein n=1 Tax=Pseudoneurospora amorphoporcata TaxID=241081 RepID=A0AAN6NZ99_9PEZI|nr:hypothetical protein QBC32DRAFT_104957 [Pseudoneurospora amorphoporcata]